VGVVPSGLPFWQQVRLFAEASHVIGAHGSDLANLIFCRPGTAVCELRPDSRTAWSYRHLAAMRGLRYGCIEGVPAAPNKGENSTAAWRIERDACEAALEDPRFASD